MNQATRMYFALEDDMNYSNNQRKEKRKVNENDEYRRLDPKRDKKHHKDYAKQREFKRGYENEE